MKLQKIPESQIIEKIKFENHWWKDKKIDNHYANMPRRIYFNIFMQIINAARDHRAVVLLGQRGIGKTAMLSHTIQELINQGICADKIVLISFAIPVFKGLNLKEVVKLSLKALNVKSADDLYFIFEEIQYLNNWEEQLEQVASNYHKTLFIGSSSIGIKSANKRKASSKRFHSFLLPVLSFYEFIEIRNQQNPINFDDDYSDEQIGIFNQYLLDYINYGNYSSVVISSKINHEQVRLEGSRYLHQILLRDLPNLYGINKLYKLNSFTSLLAYNSGVETNVEELSALTGFTQQTVVKYLNYLEHIFLIKRIYRFADRHKDERDSLYFRVYISNPSLRTALFTPLSDDNIRTEYMVETAILAQWQHIEKDMFYYCKHDHVIIDLIKVDENKNPIWITDVRWQHPHGLAPNELDIVGHFCEKYGLISSMITTKQTRDIIPSSNVIHSYEPASLYCYTIGKQIVEDKLIDSQ